jgi:hypothetical protein
MIRVGDLARQLSEQDVAAVERIVPGGRKLWLLVGETAQGRQTPRLEVYFPPDTTTDKVRRGSMVLLARVTPAGWAIGDPQSLHFLLPAERIAPAESANYAQVAITGRGFDIQTAEDLNRPFLIHGTFDDTTLLSIVDVFRGDPTANPTASLKLPIASIFRFSEDSVRVTLRTGPGSRRYFNLRLQGQRWTVSGQGGGGG